MPFLPRKSGIPALVETPAPLRNTVAPDWVINWANLRALLSLSDILKPPILKLTNFYHIQFGGRNDI